MNHTSTSIYDGLDLTENHDIPEAVADALGEFIREEILTQPILQEDQKGPSSKLHGKNDGALFLSIL